MGNFRINNKNTFFKTYSNLPLIMLTPLMSVVILLFIYVNAQPASVFDNNIIKKPMEFASL